MSLGSGLGHLSLAMETDASKGSEDGDSTVLAYFMGGFHKWGTPKNGWFIRENPI